MRVVMIESHSVYEAFQKYGLGDGDCPCGEVVMGRVVSALEDLGYAAERIGGIHNQAIWGLVHRQRGKVVDLAEVANRQGIDLEEGPAAVRQTLLAAGLHDVVQELDRLDREEVLHSDSGDILPSYVLVRHPNQGDVVDVHPFPAPSEAARFAIEQEQEGEDVELIVPRSDPAPGRRYRQLTEEEEVERLAAS